MPDLHVRNRLSICPNPLVVPRDRDKPQDSQRPRRDLPDRNEMTTSVLMWVDRACSLRSVSAL